MNIRKLYQSYIWCFYKNYLPWHMRLQLLSCLLELHVLWQMKVRLQNNLFDKYGRCWLGFLCGNHFAANFLHRWYNSFLVPEKQYEFIWYATQNFSTIIQVSIKVIHNRILTFLSASPELTCVFLSHASQGFSAPSFVYFKPQHFN